MRTLRRLEQEEEQVLCLKRTPLVEGEDFLLPC